MATTYITWSYYGTTYKGSATTEAAFPAYALRASKMVDFFTSDRVADIITDDDDADLVEAIKFAVCAVMDVIIAKEASSKEIASESVGGHSVSYVQNADMSQTAKKAMLEAAREYLDNTDLLYRGL